MRLEQLDSRRLTGANIVWDRPGAVIDVAVDAADAGRLVACWQRHARRLLDAVGWQRQELASHRYSQGVALAVSAPVDALYAACEINEAAFAAAAAELRGEAAGIDDTAALRAAIAAEVNPPLLALAAAAAAHDVAFMSDDDEASVGLGTGSQTWPARSLPPPEDVDWGARHDIPVALVTGTNGKTTTVRMAAAIARAAGRVDGISSTDCIAVGGEVVDRGDYAGAGGARTLLRDRRVEVAILETARGGLLRRGLGVPRANAALITRIAHDHLSDFGSHNLDELLDAKWLVTRALGPGDRLVLNADDPLLVARMPRSPAPVVLFGLEADGAALALHADTGGEVWTVRDGRLRRCRNGAWTVLADVADVPLALGGAARHNVANALAAGAVTSALGIPDEAVAAGLLAFSRSDNPGRSNLFEVGGVQVLVDFAHNPDAMTAVLALARRLPAQRRLVALGQAGDRDDDLIRRLVDVVWRMTPDRVITLEIPKYARGRAPGEIGAVMRDELLRLGARPEQLAHHQTEIAALEDALQWARAGDLVILFSLAEQAQVLERLQSTG